VNNGTTSATGEIDGAAFFNGLSQSVDVSGFNLNATSVTIEVWAKSDTMTSERGILVNKERVNNDWNFYLEDGNLICRGNSSGSGPEAVTAPSNDHARNAVEIRASR
jgi:hypothetical protein